MPIRIRLRFWCFCLWPILGGGFLGTLLGQPPASSKWEQVLAQADQAFYGGQMAIARTRYQQAADLIAAEQGPGALKITDALQPLAVAEVLTGHVAQGFSLLDSCERIIRQHVPDDHPFMGDLYNQKAIVHQQLGQYDRALACYQQAMRRYQGADSQLSTGLTNVYNNMGTIFELQYRFQKALRHFQLADELTIQAFGPNSLKRAHPQLNLGIIHARLGRWEASEHHFDQVLSIAESFPLQQAYWLLVLWNEKGQAYARAHRPQRALRYFEQADSLALDLLGPAASERFGTAINLGYAHILNKQPEAAIALLTDTKRHVAQSFGQDYLNWHLLLHNLAMAYLQHGRLDSASFYAQKALSHTEYDRDRSSVLTTSENPLDVVELLITLGEIYRQIYHSKGADPDLKQAQDYLLAAQRGLSEQQRRLSNRQDQQVWLDQLYRFYTVAISLELDQGTDQHQRTAFALCEESRAQVLRRNIQFNNKLLVAGVPDSLLALQRRYDAQLNQLEQQLRYLQVDAPDANADVRRLRVAGFTLQKQKDSLIAIFKERYPQYFDLLHGSKVVDVATLQSELSPDQALLEYLLGDTSLFVFVIRPDTYVVKKIPRDSLLDEQIMAFTEVLRGCPDGSPGDCDRAAQRETQRELGHWLYQQLIAPVAKLLPNRLVIVPDGELGYLPFEALLTEATTANQPDLWPFWLREKTISYAFSATLWREMKQREHREVPGKSLLAIAPRFEGPALSGQFALSNDPRRGYFGPLEGTQEEVAAIQALLGGDLLVDTAATLANFLRLAQDYRILHFATHGKVMEDPRFSLLAFYGPQDSVFLSDAIAHGIAGLYLADLYNLQLNADLVVLSACETGLGRLYRGEGIASLARGFTYAGAKSLVPSLWAVGDLSTKRLMEDFYSYLAEGMPKDSALREAKMKRLVEAGDPSQWAAFVLMGDASPIERRAWGWLGWVIGGIIISLVGYGGWRRSKRSKQARRDR